MLFGWGERKVIKTKNLTPQTNPLGTRRCFVHPWRLGGSTVWGDEFPPLVVACPPAGRTIPHPWSSTTPPLGAWLRLPPPHAFLVSYFWMRVPPLACVKAGTCALGGEPGEATRPREVAAVAMGSWGTGRTQWHRWRRNRDDYGFIVAARPIWRYARRVANVAGPLRCKDSGFGRWWLSSASSPRRRR
jgi:hypothetical protein